MGRGIAGAVVGFISTIVVSAIIVIVLAFIIGTSGILEPETFAPTTTWLAILFGSRWTVLVFGWGDHKSHRQEQSWHLHPRRNPCGPFAPPVLFYGRTRLEQNAKGIDGYESGPCDLLFTIECSGVA